MYNIVNWGRLRQFSHIIWDIDGTITHKDTLSEEVTIKIINLASMGVYHSFITGRDGQWIIENVINPMSRFYNFAGVRANLLFFGESGSVTVTIDERGESEVKVHPIVEGHPLVDPGAKGIRAKLRTLTYDPKTLKTFRRSIPRGHDVIYDANGKGYLVNVTEALPKLAKHVWSPYKQVCVSFEKVRDEKGDVKPFAQEPFGEIVHDVLHKEGVVKRTNIGFSSTAIDIVPVVDGKPFGKRRAAGIALEFIRENALGGAFTRQEVMSRTVCVGDGSADLDFTAPVFPGRKCGGKDTEHLPMIFVGEAIQLPGQNDERYPLRKNIIIEATGLGELQFYYGREEIKLDPARGPRVASAILDFLKSWDYFGKFD